MLFIKGKVKNSYGQKTKNGTDFLIHEFEERARDGHTIIQNVKDFQCQDVEEGKEVEIPVFVVAYSRRNGEAGYDLIRISENEKKGAKGGPKL